MKRRLMELAERLVTAYAVVVLAVAVSWSIWRDALRRGRTPRDS